MASINDLPQEVFLLICDELVIETPPVPRISSYFGYRLISKRFSAAILSSIKQFWLEFLYENVAYCRKRGWNLTKVYKYLWARWGREDEDEESDDFWKLERDWVVDTLEIMMERDDARMDGEGEEWHPEIGFIE